MTVNEFRMDARIAGIKRPPSQKLPAKAEVWAAGLGGVAWHGGKVSAFSSTTH